MKDSVYSSYLFWKFLICVLEWELWPLFIWTVDTLLILVRNLLALINVKMQVLTYNLPKQIIHGDFFHWCPPEKLKYRKPRLGESTLTYIVQDTSNLAQINFSVLVTFRWGTSEKNCPVHSSLWLTLHIHLYLKTVMKKNWLILYGVQNISAGKIYFQKFNTFLAQF